MYFQSFHHSKNFYYANHEISSERRTLNDVVYIRMYSPSQSQYLGNFFNYYKK